MPELNQLSIEELVIKAESGDAVAAFEIGERYRLGEGVAYDPILSQKWLSVASDLGHADARLKLGISLTTNEGGHIDLGKAKQLFESLVNSDLRGIRIAALFNLSQMYRKGLGCEINLDIAKYYLEEAAREGDAGAMVNLATMLTTGDGGIIDFVKARELSEKAAAVGNPMIKSIAMFNIGLMYKMGQGVAIDIHKAMQWFKDASDLGHTNAMLQLAIINLIGEDGQADISMAKHWSEKASEAGNPIGMILLANILENGYGQPKNPTLAKQLTEKAAKTGDADALYHLALIYSDEIHKNYKKAEFLFFEASKSYKYSYLSPLFVAPKGKYSNIITSLCPLLKDLSSKSQNFIVTKRPKNIKQLPATLAHYTNIAAVRSILDDQIPNEFRYPSKSTSANANQNSLRLYNVLYMNDPSEGKALVEFSRKLDGKYSLHKFFPDTEGSLPEDLHARMIYCVSFTANNDRLDLWRMYTNNAEGLCISIPKEDFKRFLDGHKTMGHMYSLIYQTSAQFGGSIRSEKFENTTEPVANNSNNSFSFIRVMYGDKDKRDFLESIQPILSKIESFVSAANAEIADATRKAVRLSLLDVLYSFKDKEYETENEYRLLALREMNDVCIDDGNKLFIQTPKFMFENKGGEIIIGPRHREPVKTRLELEYILEKQLHAKQRKHRIVVKQSIIPYR